MSTLITATSEPSPGLPIARTWYGSLVPSGSTMLAFGTAVALAFSVRTSSDCWASLIFSSSLPYCLTSLAASWANA